MTGKKRTVNLDDLKESRILKQGQKDYLKSALLANRLGEGISRVGIDKAKRNIL